MLIARILKARTHAGALAEYDDRFRAIAKLFVSGTAILLDAVKESGDARVTDSIRLTESSLTFAAAA